MGVLSALVAVHAGCAVFRAIVVAREVAASMRAFGMRSPREECTRWKQLSANVQQPSSRIFFVVE